MAKICHMSIKNMSVIQLPKNKTPSSMTVQDSRIVPGSKQHVSNDQIASWLDEPIIIIGRHTEIKIKPPIALWLCFTTVITMIRFSMGF